MLGFRDLEIFWFPRKRNFVNLTELLYKIKVFYIFIMIALQLTAYDSVIQSRHDICEK